MTGTQLLTIDNYDSIDGFINNGIFSYVYNAPFENTVPIYRYFN